MLSESLILLLICSVAIIYSARIIVNNFSKISKFLRIGEFLSSFIIIGIMTSLPELVVGVISSLEGVPAFSLGNLIGANIIDITLIVGIFVLFGKSINTRYETARKDIFYVALLSIMPAILFYMDNSLSRFDGIILILSYIMYSIYLIENKRKVEKIMKNQKELKNIWINVGLFLIGFTILILSSNVLIENAKILSLELSLPPIFIGIFLISIGTTLPEFSFGIQAIRMGHKKMALGDQIGTVAVNSSLILGIVALIHPITTVSSLFFVASGFLLLSILMLYIFMKSDKKLTEKEGILLILLYIIFIAIEFFVEYFIVS